MKRHLATLLLLAGFASPEAMACLCSPGEAQQPLEKADSAFVGRPVKIEVVSGAAAPAGTWQRLRDSVSKLFGDPPKDTRFEAPVFLGAVRVTFEVSEYLKGSGPKRLQIMTGYGDSDCGLSVSISTTYKIYARRSDGALRTSYCYGSDEFVRRRTAPSCAGS